MNRPDYSAKILLKGEDNVIQKPIVLPESILIEDHRNSSETQLPIAWLDKTLQEDQSDE